MGYILLSQIYLKSSSFLYIKAFQYHLNEKKNEYVNNYLILSIHFKIYIIKQLLVQGFYSKERQFLTVKMLILTDYEVYTRIYIKKLSKTDL